ncbi:hypothetical protein TNCV_174421 [Trichonephila clavipes]|nr:hypothetical protein TNCV_174421 [Trichonephila clavipes]
MSQKDQVLKLGPRCAGIDHCKGLRHKDWKGLTLSKGRRVESIAGPSRLPDCRLNKSTTVESRTGEVVDVITRPAKPEQQKRTRNKQAERPVRSNPATTKETFPILSTQTSEGKRDGIPEDRKTSKSTWHPSQQKNKEKKPQYESVGWRSGTWGEFNTQKPGCIVSFIFAVRTSEEFCN